MSNERNDDDSERDEIVLLKMSRDQFKRLAEVREAMIARRGADGERYASLVLSFAVIGMQTMNVQATLAQMGLQPIAESLNNVIKHSIRAARASGVEREDLWSMVKAMQDDEVDAVSAAFREGGLAG